MKIEIEFLGPMRRPWPERARPLDVEERSSVSDVLRQVGYTEEETTHLTFSVNGVPARLAQSLTDGDQLSVMLLLGGG